MCRTQLWLHNGRHSTDVKYDLAVGPVAGNLAWNNTSLGWLVFADGKL